MCFDVLQKEARMKALHCILVLLLLLSTGAQAQDAPAGYSWQAFKPGKIAVLKPDGWFVKAESRNGTEGLFISQEPIGPGGEFQTGLSVNFVSGIRARANVTATDYARSFLATAAEKHTVLTSFGKPLAEGIAGLGLRVRVAEEPPYIIHYFLIADDNADSLHLLFFEAPEASWESAWKHGQLMLKGRTLD
jgi:hypothetical protein